ncbi:sugar phosphate isomerase/epimerase [Streptomyces sp. NPDC003077]|uniref:sugar phosphate isomerase/epimerase family protein n=1 Tax=Streptomyces sp. NPDC003077 TaxID=3154443 RepID=UPI0033A150AA
MTLRNADFEYRVKAAYRAGFDGIGLRVGDYREARAQGWSDDGMRGLLAEYGLHVAEVELLRSWWTAPSPESAREEDDAFRIADLFGAGRVNAGLPDGTAETDLVREYVRLCARAEIHGLMVPLEFMPYGAITSLAQAHHIVERADRPNGGLLIDTWHCHRTGVTAADLAALPPERIISVQICDARPVPHPDLRHEARHLRLLPGEGVADIVGALRTLGRCTRVAGVSVEVMSDSLDGIPPDTAAALARSAAQGVLDESDWT